MTALSLYGTQTASSTLATACKFVTSTGGTSANLTTKVGQIQGSGELFSLGSTATFPGTSVSSTAGVHGYLWDVTTLEGQTIAAGTWTVKFNLNWNATWTTMSSTITARVWKRSSAGVYTKIGSDMTVAGPGASVTTQTLYTLTGSSFPAVDFATGDKLYLDVWLTVTSTGGATTRTVALWASSSTTLGIAGQVQIDTPGYSPTVKKDISTRLLLTDAYRQVILTNSPVPIRYYHLGERTGTIVKDLGSQAQDGTIVAAGTGVTLNQAGLLRNDPTETSMLFTPASAGYITIPTTGLPTGASAWSIEAWVKMPATLPSGFPTVFTMGTTSTNQAADILYRSSGGVFELDDWSGIVITGVVPAVNTVYHLVATYDGTTAKLYTNGVLTASAAKTFALGSTFAQIGNDSTTDYWSGNISDVAIYDAALSSAQIKSHYDVGYATRQDILTRFRLTVSGGGTQVEDISTRFRQMSAPGLKDIASRFRQRSAGQIKDVATRVRFFSSPVLKDSASRFRQRSADALKDISTRIRVISLAQFKDTATRLRLRSANQIKDATTRFRIAWYKDTATRLRVRSADSAKDIASRLRQMSALSQKDTRARLRLQSASQLKDIAARFRQQSANQLRDVALRLRLLSAPSRRDIASRFKQTGAIFKDMASRFRQRIDPTLPLTIISQDTFAGRSVTGSSTVSFGTASNGEVWQAPLGGIFHTVFGVASGEGYMYYDGLAGTTASGTALLGKIAFRDVDITCRFKFGTVTSNPVFNLYFRVTDINNSNAITINATTGAVRLERWSTGNNTSFAMGTFGALTSGSYYHLRVQADGTTFRAKVWADGSGEPSTFAYSVSDTFAARQVAGFYGVGVEAVAATTQANGVQFDNLVVSEIYSNQHLYVSPTGSDANDGSHGAPFATVQFGLHAISPGGTLHLNPGTYAQASGVGLTMAAGGNAANRIQVVSDTKWAAKITGTNIFTIFTVNGSYVDIIGIDLSATDTICSYGLVMQGDYASVQRCFIHDIYADNTGTLGGAGVSGQNAANNYISGPVDLLGNFITRIGLDNTNANAPYVHSIYMSNQGGNVQNNIVVGSVANAFQGGHGFSNFNISNNTFVGNTGGGIYIWNAGGTVATGVDDYTTITNNIIAYNTGAVNYPPVYGLWEYWISGFGINGPHNVYSNNLLYGNATAPSGPYAGLQYEFDNTGTLVNSLFTAPQLKNYQQDGSGDYHLSSISPAINAGLSTYTPTTDYDGVSRPQWTAPDIGAYEFVPVTQDIATRLRLRSSNQLKDITARIRLRSANQFRDLSTRFSVALANTGVKDIATRLRVQSALQLRDLAGRLRIVQVRLRDITTRFRVRSLDQLRDVVSRLRVMSALQNKDTASRFRQRSSDQFKDVKSRLRLQSASQLRDLPTRLRVQSAAQLKDIASRLRLVLGINTKDMSARVRLRSADQLRDIASRLVLASASQRLKDIASRLRLQSALQFKDVKTRLLLSVLRTKDITTRVRLMSAGLAKDTASRFSLRSANQLRDVSARLRQMSMAQTRDVSTRLRQISARSMKDVVSRLRLSSASALRDISGRVRLRSANLLRDVASRVLLISQPQRKDTQARYRLSSAWQFKDVKSRFTQRSANQLRDVTLRLVLAVAQQRNKDVQTRLRIMSSPHRGDLTSRLCLYERTPNADMRIRRGTARMRTRSGRAVTHVRSGWAEVEMPS